MKNKGVQQGWTPQQLGSLNGKTFVITGANSGTGFEAIKILLRQGAAVIMLNRNEQKTQKAIAQLKQELGDDCPVFFIQMDLGDFSQVRLAAAELLATVPQIDALICNAAVGQMAERECTVEGFESHLGINHYGHFLLVNLLFDRIEKSKGRIVVVSSEGYKMGLKTIQFDDMNFEKNYNPMTTYCHSKLAQMMFGYELHKRARENQRNVAVYVCHPGAAKTSLINEKASRKDRILFSIMSLLPIVQSAEKGAYPEVMCATTKDLNPEAYYGPTGTMNWTGPLGECTLEPFAIDRTLADQLWTVSEQATQCQWIF